MNFEVQLSLQGGIVVNSSSTEEPCSIQMVCQIRLVVLVVVLDERTNSFDDWGVDDLNASNGGGRV
jgi:hypothetical protein